MKKFLLFISMAIISVSASLAQTNLIISEVADPGDEYTGRFVELYNAGATTIDFSTSVYYFTKQVNAGSSYADVQLTGTILPGATYIIADATGFNTHYGFDPDLDFSDANGNGDDAYFIYADADHTSGTLIDIYGALTTDGSGEAWEYTDGRAIRNPGIDAANSTWTAAEWTIFDGQTIPNFTPGSHIFSLNSTLTDILIDGVSLSDFDALVTSYQAISSALPTVTSAKYEAAATVAQVDATNLDGTLAEKTTTITVTSADQVYSTVYEITFIKPATVATIADLRVATEDEYYTLTGAVLLSYQNSSRNQKYIQDATGGILIDDPSGAITTIYSIGDEITGISGTLTSYNGLMEFIPILDPGAATSTGNDVVPTVMTVEFFNANLSTIEATLVKIMGVTFADEGSVWDNYTDFSFSDDGDVNSGTIRFSYDNLDYIDAVVPKIGDLVGVVSSYNGTAQLIPRSAADIMAYSSDATLSDLAIDATTVTDFDAATLTYAVELGVGTTTVPTVTFTTTEAGASGTVTDATDLFGDEAARTITVEVTAEDGTVVTYTIVFTVDNTSVNLNSVASISVYPVPAIDEIKVKGLGDTESFIIVNVLGSTVRSINVTGDEMRINISNLDAGIYMIRTAESTIRFMKK